MSSPCPSETHDAAAALMAAFSLTRDAATLPACRALVSRALASAPHAAVLPQVICYVRNHGKSVGPGRGAGEKRAAEMLAVALFEADAPAGAMLMRMLVCYGSWKSLVAVLRLCDGLRPAGEAPGETGKGNVRIRRGNGAAAADSTWSGAARPAAAAGSRFEPLVSHIHALFADQLRQDAARLSSGPDMGVSNCSKFAPHEGRSGMAMHADAIARLVFRRGAKGKKASGKKASQGLRRRYRQLRSKLNERNGHLADRMLSMRRAGELECTAITAGFLAKSRRALLNLPKTDAVKNAKPAASAKRRYDSLDRIDLRARVLQHTSKVANIPAPSSISELADAMLDLSQNADADFGECLILNQTFERAIHELTGHIKGRINEAAKLRKALGWSKEAPTSFLREFVMAVDVSPSQSHCLHIKALLCLLFADASDSLHAKDLEEQPRKRRKSDTRGGGGGGGGGGAAAAAAAVATAAREPDVAPPASREHWCCIFDQHGAMPVKLPDSGATDAGGPAAATPLERLHALTKVFRARDTSTTAMVMDGEANVAAAIDCVLELEAAKASPNKSDVILCSDFAGDAAVVAAERYATATGGATISAWKMVAPGRSRLRQIAWDPANPQIDICFVLDTTGSMGGQIQACKDQVTAILDSLQGGSDTPSMPVACSFVSYKDFGDAGHLDTHPWSDAGDAAAMGALRTFIAGLSPSGGADIEEDVAGGFEKARDLMAARAAPSIKLVVLIADAAGHGYPNGRPNHLGVDQKKRLENVTRDLCGRLGCELLLAKIRNHTTPMREDMDSWLLEHKTFVDEFDIQGASSSVFKDKVLASFQQVVAAAVAPPTAQGIDVYGGCDFGVTTTLATSRIAAHMSELAEIERAKAAASTAALDVDIDIHADEVISAEMVGKPAASAFANMLAKCTGEDYALVRVAMGAIRSGVFASYVAEAGPCLAEACVRALVDAGATLPELKAAGYPESVLEVFEEVATARLTRGAAI
jgi:hypothetical protein